MASTIFPLGINDPTSNFHNYIQNFNAETDTNLWNAYADSAATSPVDGTGGSPNVTITRTTTNPLRGSASFLLTKDAVNRQGNGISTDFVISSIDQGQSLGISFEYSIGSGTFADGDVSVYLYDLTNATIIQPAPTQILNASVGVKWTGSFQTAINSTSYRLILHVASTSAIAYTLKFDNVFVGNNKISGVIPKMPTVTRLLTGTGLTYSTPAGCQFIRVRMCGGGGGGGGGGTTIGTSATAGGSSTFGAFLTAGGGALGVAGQNNGAGGAGGTNTISSPAVTIQNIAGGVGSGGGWWVNTGTNASAVFVGVNGGQNPLGGAGVGSYGATGLAGQSNTGAGGGSGGATNAAGLASQVGGAGGAGGYLEVIINNPSVTYTYTVGSAGNGGGPGTNGNGGGNGGTGYIEVTEYYVGTNTLLSDQTDTRVVAFRAHGAPSGTPFTTYAPANVTIITSVDFDTHGAYNTGTGKYTVPVAGKYRITASSAINGSGLVNYQNTVLIQKNGTTISQSDYYYQTTYNGVSTTNSHAIADCVAGDTLWFNGNFNVAAVWSGTNNNYFQVERIAGPNQIAASEVVAASYYGTTNTIGQLGTPTTLVFTNRLHDTHLAYNTSTGVFTCPVAGKYRVVGGVHSPDAAPNGVSAAIQASIKKNGSMLRYVYESAYSTNGIERVATVHIVIDCVAGDQIIFTAGQNFNGGTISITNDVSSYIDIAKI